MAVTTQAASEVAMAEDLGRLVHLVDEGHVEEARRLAPELAQKWPDSRPIQHLNRVLKPPEVIPSPPGLRGRNLDREHAWLREHAHEYHGRLRYHASRSIRRSSRPARQTPVDAAGAR